MICREEWTTTLEIRTVAATYGVHYIYLSDPRKNGDLLNSFAHSFLLNIRFLLLWLLGTSFVAFRTVYIVGSALITSPKIDFIDISWDYYLAPYEIHSIFTSNVFISIRYLITLLYADSAVPWFQLQPHNVRNHHHFIRGSWLTLPTAQISNASCRMNQTQAPDWGTLKRS